MHTAGTSDYQVFIPVLDRGMADGNARFLQSCEVNGISVHMVPRFGTPGFGAALTGRAQRAGKRSLTVVALYVDKPSDLIFAAEQTEILRGFQDITHPNKVGPPEDALGVASLKAI